MIVACIKEPIAVVAGFPRPMVSIPADLAACGPLKIVVTAGVELTAEAIQWHGSPDQPQTMLEHILARRGLA